MTITRRHLLAASAATPVAAAASLAPITASASAPVAGAQVPGVYRTKVGEAEVTALLDGYLDIATGLFSSYNEGTVDASLAAYGHKLQNGGVRAPVNGYLINAGGKLTLIDTGTASFFGETLGALHQNLAAAGVSVEEIDQILLTHMHVDHVGGLIDADGKAAFPNAELVVSEAEWNFWYNDEIMAAAGDGAALFFNGARMTTAPYKDRLKLFSGEADLGTGLSAMPLPGHTAGHSGFNLASGDETLLFWGDVIHMTGVQFADPNVTLTFDTDAEQTRKTRARMLDMAAADGLKVTGAHIDFPGFGQVLREGSAYRYQAAPWTYAF